MSRRSWIAAVLVLAATGACSRPRTADPIGEPDVGYGNPVPCPTDAVTAETIRERAAAFEARSGVPIRLTDLPAGKGVTFDAVTEVAYPAIAFYLTVLTEEMDKYPGEGFRKAQVSVLGFTDNLKLNGKGASGIAEFNNHSILFHFNYAACDADWAAATFHHEVFHHLDVVGGILPEWPVAGAVSGARAMYRHLPGLVSNYAGTSAIEDKAETFSAMLMQSWIGQVETWARADALLLQKVNLVRDAVSTLGAGYGHDYWAKLREGSFVR